MCVSNKFPTEAVGCAAALGATLNRPRECLAEVRSSVYRSLRLWH